VPSATPGAREATTVANPHNGTTPNTVSMVRSREGASGAVFPALRSGPDGAAPSLPLRSGAGKKSQ
jgi:hypothetical protein